jgi:PIN domain
MKGAGRLPAPGCCAQLQLIHCGKQEMKIILDTNTWYENRQWNSNRAASLFDYLKRTSSSLVILSIVLEEVLGTYERQLRQRVEQATNANIRAMNAAAKVDSFLISIPGGTKRNDIFSQTVDISVEQVALKEKLLNPAPGISAVVYDASKVDIQEVWRRGINRKRPADQKGEELRDVIIWLAVLRYARDSKESVAFISKDSGFWDGDNPHADILADISEAQLDIALYQDVEEFNRHHAFHAKTLDVEAISNLVDVRALDTKVVECVSNWLAALEVDGQVVTFLSGEVIHASFDPGTVYDTGPNLQSVVVPYKASLLVKMLFPSEPPSWDVHQVGARASIAWHHYIFTKVASVDTEAPGIRRTAKPSQYDGYESTVRILVEGEISLRIIAGRPECPELDSLRPSAFYDDSYGAWNGHVTPFKDWDWATGDPPLENLRCPECGNKGVSYEVGGRMYCRQCGAMNYCPS